MSLADTHYYLVLYTDTGSKKPRWYCLTNHEYQELIHDPNVEILDTVSLQELVGTSRFNYLAALFELDGVSGQKFLPELLGTVANTLPPRSYRTMLKKKLRERKQRKSHTKGEEIAS